MTSTRPNPTLLALLVACAMFMAQLDSTIVLTALPQIAASFQTSAVDLSIGVTAYIVAQTVFLPSSAWVADRFGARRVFALAIAGFTLASILCGLCRTLPEFIAARALQGFAAALMTPVGRVLMLQSTEKSALVRVMTISTVPMLVAPTIGPPVGGLIVTYLSWPWIFFLNVPIGIATIALVLRYAPVQFTAIKRPFDGAGFVLTSIAVVTLLYGLDRLASPDAGEAVPLLLVGTGLVFGYVAYRHARTHEHPLISLSPLRIPTFYSTTVGGGALARIPARAIMFILPLMFQVAMGYSAFVSGMLLLAVSSGDLLLKIATTRTFRRFGFRNVLLVCGFFSALTIGVCALFTTETPLWAIFALLFASGMFRSLLFTGLGTLTYVDVPQEEIGASTVLWNMMQQITNALSVSVSALLFGLSSVALSEGGQSLSLANCRFTLIVMAAIGSIALISFYRMPPDAGAQVSGHKSEKPS